MKWTKQLENFFMRKRVNNVTNNTSHKDVSTDNTTECKQPTPLPINFNLRMLIITDTHGCLGENDIPQRHMADVCLLLGDMSMQDIAIIKEQVTDIPIYGVLGNHDGFELYDRCGIENIHGKVVEVNGVRISGIGGSLKYKDSPMPLYTDEESVEIAERMQKADILISHDSPKFLHSDQDFAHSGLQGVTHYCEKYGTPLNIHGHHHDSKEFVLENGTKSICCFKAQVISISPGGCTVND